jgi:5-methyltetrahydrofolate--homocysteine methyltransferase
MAYESEILGKLRDAIVELDILGVQDACEEVVASGMSAYRAVIEGMAKGMEIVGQKYEDGEYYLAELIMAGETMREGMVVLEPHFTSGEISRAGKAVLGTVKGDLHDIGKNVFLTLLRAANYDVIDLGVDVSPEGFLKAVKEHTPDILAMSALLTTTMVEMENVVEKLVSERVRDGLKILIGGAPITDDFAQKIGADAAARDAVDGIRIVNQWTSASRLSR